jgi:hypothetical protein
MYTITRYWKPCGCGGIPECQTCNGSGFVRDWKTESEDADRWHDEQKDRRIDEKHYKKDDIWLTSNTLLRA